MKTENYTIIYYFNIEVYANEPGSTAVLTPEKEAKRGHCDDVDDDDRNGGLLRLGRKNARCYTGKMRDEGQELVLFVPTGPMSQKTTRPMYSCLRAL